MATAMVNTLEADLRRLAAERHGDPFRALPQVDEILVNGPDDPAMRGLACWVRGVLLHELARYVEAIESFHEAIGCALDAGDTDVEARARANLAITLMQVGKTAEAAIELKTARGRAPSSARGFVLYLSALHAQRQGDHRRAIDGYDAALPTLVRRGDHATAGLLYLNRSVARIYLGMLDGAHSDLVRAEELALREQFAILAAMASHNLSFLEGRRGNLADALLRLDMAEAAYAQLDGRPRQLPVVFSDRAETLLNAGLATDARAEALRAIDELSALGSLADLTEAQLLLARACLAADDPAAARVAALDAARGFRASRRPAWSLQAVFVGRQTDLARAREAGRPAVGLGPRFARLATSLTRHGWSIEASDAFVHAALSVLPEDPVSAAEHLRRAGRAGFRGPPVVRSRWYLACARLAAASGEHASAARSVRLGVRDASRVVAATGSTEATLTALRQAGELAQVGVEIARRGGDASELLHCIERKRAVVSMLPSARATRRPEVGAALSGIRAGGSPGEVEARVRDEALRTSRDLHRTGGARWAAVRAALRDRSLVYFATVGTRLLGVVVTARSTRVIELCTAAEVMRADEFAHFALSSFAFTPADRSDRAAQRLWRDLAEVDRMLIAPLHLDTSSVTIVPNRATERVLWSLLPGLRDVDVSLAPSAASWLSAVEWPAPASERVVLVEGPGLAASGRELRRLHELYPDAVVLAGDEARVAAVLEAFEGAALVHVAAHGVFRSDSPMFSRIELADGPLTIHDFEQLECPPHTLVLSACEAAAARHYQSGAAIGTARALVSIGASAVVAAVREVEDEATCEHMVCFHRHLVGGVGTARSLRLATLDALHSGERSRVAAAGAFITIGAG